MGSDDTAGQPPDLETLPADADRSGTAEESEQAAEARQQGCECIPENAPGEPVTISAGEYAELKAKAAERDEYLLRLQRAVADYQNLLRRIERTREAAARDSLRRAVEGLLPLADSLAMALDAAEQVEGGGQMIEGLRIAERAFYGAFAKLGIEPIHALGQPFDPHYHEAAMQEPAEGVEPNTVVRELKKGLVKGEEVIRASQVAVSAPPRED
jgi:molecular chaperone GrpE